MNKKAFWLMIVVGMQVLWMVGTAVSKELDLTRNTTVLLETLPVDPRDWLRGDFVILNYKISTIPIGWLQPFDTEKSLNNRAVYVALEPRGKFYEAVAASLEPIQSSPGRYVVRGSIEDSGGILPRGSVRVKYGAERFYVPEGTGNPNGAVTVKCVVARDSLLIKEVYVNGRPYAATMRERNQ